MDVNDMRVLSTLLMFTAFIGIVVWALARHRRSSFDEAAQLPFLDDLPAAGPQGEKK